jgi:putative selenium metabolism protein SsnA
MLITNGTVITLDESNRVIHGGAVCIRGDAIADVGTTPALMARYPAEDILDARGKLVMPGNICAHTHFYGAYARGMYIPGEPAKNFVEILQKLWWGLDRVLDEEGVRLSALVCLLDAIRHGTTTLIDHHASPNAIEGSLDIIAEAVKRSGLRACLCYEVTDRNGPEGARAGIAENARFIRKARTDGDAKIAATFGLHASFTISDETLALCRDAVAGTGAGFHLHVAEDKADQDDSLKKYGVRIVERLEKQGVLGERTIAAHCVHLDAFEMDILRLAGTKVTHQPRSNMNNAVGVADVPGMMKRGICVGLGNDGFSNNMFLEMKEAYLVHKLNRRDPRVMGADQVFAMAFANNARIASLFFGKPVGRLAAGAYADIILLNYAPYTPLTSDNFPWHFIFGVDGSHVTHTICGGQMLMKDRQILTLDEEAISARARELAPGIWRRFAELAAQEA